MGVEMVSYNILKRLILKSEPGIWQARQIKEEKLGGK